MQRSHLKTISNHHFSDYIAVQKEQNGEVSSTRKILRLQQRQSGLPLPRRKISAHQLLMIKFVTYLYLSNLIIKACSAEDVKIVSPATNSKNAVIEKEAPYLDHHTNVYTYGQAKTRETIQFDGLHAEVLSRQTLECRDKTVGLNGGLICKTENGTEYLLKPIDGNIQSSNGVIFNHKQVLYNKQILRIIGIATPKNKIFYIPNTAYKIMADLQKNEEGQRSYTEGTANFFLASEWLPGFLSLNDFMQNPALPASLAQIAMDHPEFPLDGLRIKALELQLGEDAYAKYITACSLVPDLLLNTANIGFYHKKWMVVDMDVNNIYAANTLYRFKFEVNESETIKLSLDHIKMMLKIYNNLSNKKVPTGIQYFGMDQENFDITIQSYKQACESIIANTKTWKIDRHASAKTAKLFAAVAMKNYFDHHPEREVHQSIF